MPLVLRLTLGILLLLLALPAASPALKLPYRYGDDEVKAAFLFNFAKFTAWPDSAFAGEGTPLVFAVVGPRFFEVASRTMVGKTIRGRPVEVRLVTVPKELATCHVLFISAGEAGSADQLLRGAPGCPILTVSDLEGFAGQGGMIELFEVDRRLRFAIDLAAVRQAGLALDSELLRLARIVGSPRK